MTPVGEALGCELTTVKVGGDVDTLLMICGVAVGSFDVPLESERMMAKAIAKAMMPMTMMATMNSLPMSRCINFPLFRLLELFSSAAPHKRCCRFQIGFQPTNRRHVLQRAFWQ